MSLFTLSLRERAGVRAKQCNNGPHPVLLPRGEGIQGLSGCALFTVLLSNMPFKPGYLRGLVTHVANGLPAMAVKAPVVASML